MDKEESTKGWLKMLDNMAAKKRAPNRNAMSTDTSKNLHQNECGHGYTPNDAVRICEVAMHKVECLGAKYASVPGLGSSPSEYAHRMTRKK